MTSLELLATEFAFTVADRDAWLAIGLALVLGLGCWIFGTWVARTVGLLQASAPAGEILGVGLGSGLMVLSAWWAAIWSGGRSSFTPVAVGFVLALGLALAGRRRRSRLGDVDSVVTGPRRMTRTGWPRRSLIVTALAATAFVVALALLYGSTLAPSPRDGVQPVEFVDEAFYAILGRDLVATGTETNLSPSGFTALAGLPAQTWYHWAELWLASAVIAVFGSAPLAARYFIVLPIVLLAAAALTGTFVRRMARTDSRWAYLFGFLACLFLAPVPTIPGPFFSSWAVGMVFGITLYGLGAVAVLLALHCLVALRARAMPWALATFVGSAVAFILPAHIALAVLALLGGGSAWGVRAIRLAVAKSLPWLSGTLWLRISATTGSLLVASAIWGLATGHGLGASAAPIVPAFSASWGSSVALTALGAGAFAALPIAWYLSRWRYPEADIYAGTMAVLVGGAIGWGARMGEFTTFYLFFGGIAAFATPAAAAAARTVWQHLRAARRSALAAGLVVLCGAQLELGVVTAIARLQLFGPHDYAPIPVHLLEAIRQLPEDARLAYACRPLEEVGFVTPRLLSIDAHTGRRVVPLCFQAETLSVLNGAAPSEKQENLFFWEAPQRALYPTVEARPSSAEVAAFLERHGIGYIYADFMHPNSLVNGAVLIAAAGDAQIFRLP